MTLWSNLKGLLAPEQPNLRKGAIIDLNDRTQIEGYRSLLTEMATILRDSGFEEQAGVVQTIASYLNHDGEAFALYVAGPGIWGSLGFDGAASCNIVSTAPMGSIDAARRQLRMYELFAQLADKLKADGMDNPKVESLGEHYTRLLHPTD